MFYWLYLNGFTLPSFFVHSSKSTEESCRNSVHSLPLIVYMYIKFFDKNTSLLLRNPQGWNSLFNKKKNVLSVLNYNPSFKVQLILLYNSFTFYITSLLSFEVLFKVCHFPNMVHVPKLVHSSWIFIAACAHCANCSFQCPVYINMLQISWSCIWSHKIASNQYFADSHQLFLLKYTLYSNFRSSKVEIILRLLGRMTLANFHWWFLAENGIKMFLSSFSRLWILTHLTCCLYFYLYHQNMHT